MGYRNHFLGGSRSLTLSEETAEQVVNLVYFEIFVKDLRLEKVNHII